MNKLDISYQDLSRDILENGVLKKDRTGTGTISVFGRQIRHKMSEGFPLLTSKKMAWKSIVFELLWFLKGDTNIKYLIENNCHIWDGDCYKAFVKYQKETSSIIRRENPHVDFKPLEIITKDEFINKIKNEDGFSEKWGDLGPIYGKQWRNWGGEKKWVENGGYSIGGSFGGPDIKYPGIMSEVDIKGIDQINVAIDKLKNNPDDRGIIVSSWNVLDLDQMTLRPCHYSFQFYTRELSLDERCELGYKYVNSSEWKILMTNESLSPENNCNDYKIPKRTLSLKFQMRSVDVGLGLPFNIASYGLLLSIMGKLVNMEPDELIGDLGDTHIYLNHIEGMKEQLKRIPYKLPELLISDKVNFTGDINDFLDSCICDDFKIENYKSHSHIKLPLSN